MLYLLCVLVSFIIFLYLINDGKGMDFNVVILSVICVVGNGGYYALYHSNNLDEAVLANTLTYTIGSFVPMIMFLLICKICKVNINNNIQTILYFIQCLIFLCVCSVKSSDLFYKTIEFHRENQGAYLTKTYGPVHTLYIVLFCFYLIASIAIVGHSCRKKTCCVSNAKAYVILALFIISAILYFAERYAKLAFEIEPFIFTVTSSWVILLFKTISQYSAYDNLAILDAKIDDVAYIVFDKKVRYMSCNDYALELFPELAEWEMEKTIPGNGGRFNTFLRIPFREFLGSEHDRNYVSGFEYKNKYYRIEIRDLISKKNKNIGSVIKVTHDVVKTRELTDSLK